MIDEIDLTRLAALREEKPATLMGLVRLAWPDIKAALAHGHTLKTIHERLTQGGIRIGYRRLSLYIGRLRRREAARTTPAFQTPVAPPTENHAHPPPRRRRHTEKQRTDPDPLANVRERTQNRPGFHFDDQPADETKLI